MTWYWWVMFVAAWLLIPVLLYIADRQRARQRQWDREDAAMVAEWEKKQREGRS